MLIRACMELIENMSMICFSISNFRKMVFEELGLIETPPLYIDTPLNFPLLFHIKILKTKRATFF